MSVQDAVKAALVLEEALDSGDTTVKLRAANLVFTHLLRAHEMLEIDERLETIEQALEEDGSFRRCGQL
jgi:hypothetical protein